jgi:prephenate dehydrogenase
MKAGIKLGIIGLGVIGASLGMAVRHSKADIKVWGNDIDPETESAALEMGAVDGLLSNDNLGECDIVIIAAPLSAVPEILIQIKDRLKAGATVSDVGSVKGWIMENYNRLLPPGINFIGGHPMAGSEKSGISAADKFLLQNAAYILTPHGSTPPDILTTLAEILSLAGARVIVMNAADHDRAVAKVSHLPHLMAAAVINNLQGHSSALALAGGGLRDTTRTASSSPACGRRFSCIMPIRSAKNWSK